MIGLHEQIEADPRYLREHPMTLLVVCRSNDRAALTLPEQVSLPARRPDGLGDAALELGGEVW